MFILLKYIKNFKNSILIMATKILSLHKTLKFSDFFMHEDEIEVLQSVNNPNRGGCIFR